MTSTTDPQFKASFQDIYDAVQLPWYLILGNHDYRSSLQAQLAYTGDSRWNAGLNYSFQVPLPGAKSQRDCLAVVLIDTCPLMSYYRTHDEPEWPDFLPNILRQDVEGQKAWMSRAISAASSSCVASVVVGHHPVFSAGEHGDSGDLLGILKPLLDSQGVDLYLAGHDHTLVHLRDGDVDYVISGGGSRVRENSDPTPQTVWFKDTGGFTVHSVNTTHLITTFVQYDGALLHQSLHPLRAKS